MTDMTKTIRQDGPSFRINAICLKQKTWRQTSFVSGIFGLWQGPGFYGKMEGNPPENALYREFSGIFPNQNHLAAKDKGCKMGK